MPLVFEKIQKEVKFFSPLEGFSQVSQILEFRKDPLTGLWSRINVERTKRIKHSIEKVEIDQFIQQSRERCFFCPEKIENSTPRFVFEEGRITYGEATAFPNLFPFGQYHAVVVLGKEHFVFPTEFPHKLIHDGFMVSIQFFKRVLERDPRAIYTHVNWNFMPPAAASLVHPHFQVMADEKPTYYVGLLIDASKHYFERNKSNYWSDLVEIERKGKRFIWESKHLACLTSFAPQGNNEILVISKKRSSLLEVGEDELKQFAALVCSIVRAYGKIGIDSFNMAVFSGPPAVDYYRLSAKFVSRPNLKHIYVSDAGFMERLHLEPVVETLPENVAQRLGPLIVSELQAIVSSLE